MQAILCVGAGGFLGACARYAINRGLTGLCPAFPFGTLLSNVLAGFCIGVFLGLERGAFLSSGPGKLFFTTGFLGGLSTFSAFSAETVQFFQQGRIPAAAANIVLNLGLSLLAVCLGLFTAKLLLKS
jgi:CrcB protein